MINITIHKSLFLRRDQGEGERERARTVRHLGDPEQKQERVTSEDGGEKGSSGQGSTREEEWLQVSA